MPRARFKWLIRGWRPATRQSELQLRRRRYATSGCTQPGNQPERQDPIWLCITGSVNSSYDAAMRSRPALSAAPAVRIACAQPVDSLLSSASTLCTNNSNG